MKYNILPYPKKLEEKSGYFDLTDCSVAVYKTEDYRIVRAAAELRGLISQKSLGTHKFFSSKNTAEGVVISVNDMLAPESYKIQINNNSVDVQGGDAAGCFYAIGTLTQLIQSCGAQLPALIIEDNPDMEYRGYYYDVTRGRIPTVEGVKQIIDLLAQYKINSLQLYVEHSFDFVEFRNPSRTDEDYLTPEEILELDQYCYDRFIDFIPSLSTFGHLYELLSKEEYKHLCELQDFKPSHHFWEERMVHHTIDPTNPESFKLVCSLIDQYLPLFRSKYFNICCDETFDLGKGKNVGKNSGKLYCDFVTKIINYVANYGKTVMMWGDIALEHKEALENIPKDVILLNWDYNRNGALYKITPVREQNLTQIVCPGVSSWSRLIENPDISVSNITKMAKYGFDNQAKGILNTNWGDYGHPSPFECTLYGTVIGACVGWNVSTQIDEAFEEAVSYRVYGAEANIIPIITAIANAHQAAQWIEFFRWNESRNKECFDTDEQFIREQAAICEETERRLSAFADEKKIFIHIITAAKGIALLCRAKIHILNNEDFGEWTIKAQEWLEQYEKNWRRNNKESELSEIRRFILDIAVR